MKTTPDVYVDAKMKIYRLLATFKLSPVEESSES